MLHIAKMCSSIYPYKSKLQKSADHPIRFMKKLMVRIHITRVNVDHENMNENRMDIDSMKEETVLLLEPFYGGSHKQLIDTLINGNIQRTLMINL